MSTLEPLLGTADVARLLGVPVKTVLTWRHKGTGPRGFRVGKHVKYRPQDVSTWLESLAEGKEVGQ
jgi:excisionase family DNA binding protein